MGKLDCRVLKGPIGFSRKLNVKKGTWFCLECVKLFAGISVVGIQIFLPS